MDMRDYPTLHLKKHIKVKNIAFIVIVHFTVTVGP
jgi:hypothetical protein